MMKIGFIGLGNMGAGMAANLQKAGYELVVHDIAPEAAAEHLERGALWADSPEEVARRVRDRLHLAAGSKRGRERRHWAERHSRRH